MLFCADPWVFQKPRWAITRVLQVPCSEIENAFDQAITFVVFQGGVVVLVPQQEAQRAEQDRLSGAGFARDDVQPVVQLQFEPVDQGVVFDFQTTSAEVYDGGLRKDCFGTDFN